MVPLDFWKLAGRLIENESNEERFRSSISRSYYGAYLTATALLEDMGIEFEKSDAAVHTHVRDILNNSGDHELIAVGGPIATKPIIA